MESRSLTGRAILAVGLLVGFYVLGLSLILGLLAIPWAMWIFGDRLNLRVVLFTVIPAVAIAWALRPRRDHFFTTQPRLTETDQPRLFAEIAKVGDKLGQELPAEVYLDSRVNAGVTKRGGIMGFGSRRVMFLGLPLMTGLTVSQFRSVIAHEFGHYHGGDTALGPWLYTTRSAIGRALADLSDRDFVRKPFEVYGTLFLRVTHAIGRRQEHAADLLAAQYFGTHAHTDALRRIAELSAAYESYWDQDVAPLLQAGSRPPVTAGFNHFVNQDNVKQGIDRFIADLFENEVQDPYDTHPPTKARIDALSGVPETSSVEEDNSAAIELMDDVPNLEMKLLQSQFGQVATRFNPVPWAEVGQTVYLPHFEEEAAKFSPALETVTVSDIPSVLADSSDFIDRVHSSTKEKIVGQPAHARVINAMTSGLIVALCRQGWDLIAFPGEPMALLNEDGNARLLPEVAIATLASEGPEIEKWAQGIAEAGIGHLHLAGALKTD